MSVYRPKYKDPATGARVESNVWWCEFVFAGKRYRESTKETKKTLATAYETNRRKELERQYAGLPAEPAARQRVRSVSDAVDAYCKQYKVNHRAKSVEWVEGRAEHLKRLLGKATLMDLTGERIIEYMQARQIEKAGNRTINMEVACLSRAIGKQWRELWPKVRKLEENHDVGRALSDEEEGRILGAAQRNRSPVIYRFVRIALLTGMREGEIRTLQVRRVDLEGRMLRVGKAKTPAGEGRGIPMNEELHKTLSEQVAWLKKEFGPLQPGWYLFPFCNTVKPVDPTRPIQTLKTAWRSIRDTAAVDCRLHDLRHTAATKMAENGTPEATMKALLGHMSTAMLERYSHIRQAAKEAAVEGLTLATPVIVLPKDSPKEAHGRKLRAVGN